MALKDVTKVFPGGTVALDKVSLDVADGEFMVLLGPSGCGKSTLLRIIAGLEEPTAGSVLMDGEPADDLPPRERGVAMVFQDYALYPHMNVNDNIGFPLKQAGVDLDERQRRTVDAASALGIPDLLTRRIARLSGGQRQRVAMGRAIVREPALFLMDEPLSNIDAGQRAELRTEISGLAQQLGVTVIYVTHDQTEALTMADKVAILRKGELQDVGTPDAVYNRPGTMYVAAFLGSPRMGLMEAKVEVWEDSHLNLVLGDQRLQLPWHDPRRRILSRYRGEQIVVGLRAEALTPVAPGAPGNVLAGHVRTMEHHGHETLAFIDVGATAAAVDDNRSADVARVPKKGMWNSLRRTVSRIVDGTSPADEEMYDTLNDLKPVPGRHHRRSAELAVRLTPYPQLRNGTPLSVAVDMESLHFFNPRGPRIDVGWR
nr:ABC transporter ATP-binding protein [Phytoactinopolyspora halotolerans]